ncbi:MAG: EF-hand domain-containing protein [Pseudomonadota bacterium]
MKYTVTATTAFLLVMSGIAIAQPGGGILRMDQDGDGLVSREEFALPEKRRGPRMFERADLNSDGSVTFEELQSSLEEGAAKRSTFANERFGEMDADGNQVLTLDEVLDHGFNQADANGDGFISEEEARAHFDERRGHRRSRRADG